jgi:hypothetical protein
MSDKIARVTPREIAEMIVNEQAYADTRFVLANEHEAEIERLRARVAELEFRLTPRRPTMPDPVVSPRRAKQAKP